MVCEFGTGPFLLPLRRERRAASPVHRIDAKGATVPMEMGLFYRVEDCDGTPVLVSYDYEYIRDNPQQFEEAQG